MVSTIEYIIKCCLPWLFFFLLVLKCIPNKTTSIELTPSRKQKHTMIGMAMKAAYSESLKTPASSEYLYNNYIRVNNSHFNVLHYLLFVTLVLGHNVSDISLLDIAVHVIF